MYNIEVANLYKVKYESRGYLYEEFIYKEELIDTLEKINEKGRVISVIIEEE